jgi:hypothetical protein
MLGAIGGMYEDNLYLSNLYDFLEQPAGGVHGTATSHEDGRRRVVSIQEVNGMEGDIITMSELFRFDRKGLSADGMVLGEIKATGIVPAFHKTLTAKAIDLPMKLFSGDGF